MKTKIYEIRIAGEKEWICADTAIEALKFYFGLTEMDLSDFEDEDDIVEIPKSEWDRKFIYDTDEQDKNGNYPISQTFAEFMKTATGCEMIATTNY